MSGSGGGADVQSPSASRSSDGTLRAASRMSAAILASRILGLVREQVFAFLFGASHAMDAFNVAFRIPNLLRDLFAEGAMSAALVPTFTRTRLEEGERRAWQVAARVFRVLFVLVSVIAVVGILFAEPLVGLYAGAFREVPGKFELAVDLTRLLFPFFPFVALAAAFMGVLNARGVFFLPAFASALFNFSSIVTGVLLAWLAPRWGIAPIFGMGVGVVIGGAVQAFCQLPALRRERAKGLTASSSATAVVDAPVWHQDRRLRAMLWMIIPGTLGLAATQINILVNTVLATRQGPGAVSWLNYAFRLMQFPIGLFGVAMGAATLPRVSELWVKRDLSGICDSLTRSLLHVCALNFPAAAGLAALSQPIVRLLFEHGRFTPSDTEATAWALTMYCVGLGAYSAVKVLVPACYALGKTRIAVRSSLLAVALTITLNLMWVDVLGYWGLALGTSMAAIFNQTYLMFEIRRLLKREGAHWKSGPLVLGSFKHLFAAAGMGAAVWWALQRWQALLPVEGKGEQLVQLSVLMGAGIGLTWLFARILGLRETLEMAGVFSSRLKKKLFRAQV